MKSNKRHHVYPANKAPYPRNYERLVVDQCVLYYISITATAFESMSLTAMFGRLPSSDSCLEVRLFTSLRHLPQKCMSLDFCPKYADHGPSLDLGCGEELHVTRLYTNRRVDELYRFWLLDLRVRKLMARELSLLPVPKQNPSHLCFDAPSGLQVCR
jgi:hypothetical protein